VIEVEMREHDIDALHVREQTRLFDEALDACPSVDQEDVRALAKAGGARLSCARRDPAAGTQK
jgi:hypothetical protein